MFLDIAYLLDESILAIQPFIDLEAQHYLQTLQEALKETLPALPRETRIYGICIGDVNSSNFHINDKKHIPHSTLISAVMLTGHLRLENSSLRFTLLRISMILLRHL